MFALKVCQMYEKEVFVFKQGVRTPFGYGPIHYFDGTCIIHIHCPAYPVYSYEHHSFPR